MEARTEGGEGGGAEEQKAEGAEKQKVEEQKVEEQKVEEQKAEKQKVEGEKVSDCEDLQDFLAWQCRVRQEAMRGGEGRPSEGMVARILEPEVCRDLGVIFLMHRRDADAYVSQFRFIVQSCFDPRERRERGLKVLSSTYYQNSPMFREVMTVVFSEGSKMARELCDVGRIKFLCRGGGHGFEVMGRVEELGDGDALREGSLWHNRLFSRLFSVRGELCVLGIWIEEVVRKE